MRISKKNQIYDFNPNEVQIRCAICKKPQSRSNIMRKGNTPICKQCLKQQDSRFIKHNKEKDI
jgi:formylmethanofuran dehydrogenase subunit E